MPGALTRTLLLFQLLPSYKVTCVYCHRRCISSQVYINNNKIVIIKEEKVSLPRNPVTAPLRAARLPSARAWKEESIRRGRGTLHVCLHAPLVKPRATRARCKHTAKPKPKPCCRRFVARRQRGDRSPQLTELRGRPEAPGPAPGRRRRGVGSRAPPRGYLRPPPARRPGAMAEDAMESYLYAAYPPYSYRYPPPKGKGGAGGWRPRGGYFAGYGEAAAAAAEYFDNYQRAQLKAILSQVNPNLTPRLRKANTKEVGVQVNPRQDASVQCSLGPRTLLRRRPGPAPSRPREAAPEPQAEQEQGSPATTSTRAVRFPRTVAVYSPVASRRLTAFPEEPEPPPRELQEPREPEEPPAPAAVEEERREAEAEAVRASWEKPPESEAGREAAPLEQRGAAAPEGTREEAEPREEPPAAPQKQQEAAPGKARLRFQVRSGAWGGGRAARRSR